MKTPICDFVEKYAESKSMRLHMPGHKGKDFIGVEKLDITEICGADSLYEASGIIAESEACASELFGCKTYYSTEGSSLCIRTMVYLISVYAKERGEKPLILAGRNAHKAFHSAIALLDVDVEWLAPDIMKNYLSCEITPEYLEDCLDKSVRTPTAVYITSPDYLGNIANIKALSDVCHKRGVLLMVDNAHGAYLRFLTPSQHPMDLGADMCCDSAHKTLPVLTGGAYLHLGNNILDELDGYVKDGMLLFGSTSPSYIILQSLDRANDYLESYSERLSNFVQKVERMKGALVEHGYDLYGEEPLKITILAKRFGYYGDELAHTLEERNLICEFFDRDFVALMLTPENEGDIDKIEKILLSIEKKSSILEESPAFSRAVCAMSARDAYLSSFERVDVEDSIGRIASLSTVGCPPAVPIIIGGEVVDENTVKCFKYYGIDKINVVK